MEAWSWTQCSASEIPQHDASEADGSLPVLQGGLPSQVDKVLWADQLVIELPRRQAKRVTPLWKCGMEHPAQTLTSPLTPTSTQEEELLRKSLPPLCHCNAPNSRLDLEPSALEPHSSTSE